MKKRSARLGVVLTLEEKKKREADQFLAEHVKRVENDKHQLVQLENYLVEYQNQYQKTCLEGITIQNLNSYQGFLAKIGTVIGQHKAAMEVNKQQLEEVRQYWIKVYGRYKAVGTLIDKVKTEELQEEDKALQKLIDESSQLSFSNRSLKL